MNISEVDTNITNVETPSTFVPLSNPIPPPEGPQVEPNTEVTENLDISRNTSNMDPNVNVGVTSYLKTWIVLAHPPPPSFGIDYICCSNRYCSYPFTYV